MTPRPTLFRPSRTAWLAMPDLFYHVRGRIDLRAGPDCTTSMRLQRIARPTSDYAASVGDPLPERIRTSHYTNTYHDLDAFLRRAE